jgi:putative endonuclease
MADDEVGERPPDGGRGGRRGGDATGGAGGGRGADGGRRDLGTYGERLVVRYLRERGMVVLDRNWRCDQGEVDIVALDGDCVVMCEVKTRRGTGFGEPVEAVVPRKVARLRRLTGSWLEAHPEHTGRPVRIDVVGVLARGRGPVEVRHVRGVGS